MTGDGPATVAEAPARFPWVSLLVLVGLQLFSTVGAFLPAGLLPDIATDLGVSQAQVGLFVTFFSWTIAAAAVPLTIATRRFPRKPVLLASSLFFGVACLFTAFAPSFELVLVGRVLCGLGCGVLWSLAIAYAASMVPRQFIGRAIAVNATSGTLAFAFGIPAATALGYVVGWRLSLAAVAAVSLLFLVLALWLLPAPRYTAEQIPQEEPAAAPIRQDPSLPGIVLVAVLTLIIMCGHHCFYPYMTAFLRGPAGYDEVATAGLLLLFGLMMAVGLAVCGMALDRWPRLTPAVVLVITCAGLAVLGSPWGASWPIPVGLAIWGFAAGATPVMLQGSMMRIASPRLRSGAAAFFVAAFNVAIGTGALAGGGFLEALGLGSLPFVDIALAVVGLAVVLGWGRLLAARPRSSTA